MGRISRSCQYYLPWNLQNRHFWPSRRYLHTYFEIHGNNFEITVKKPLDLNAVAEKLREEAVDDPDAIPDEEETEEDATPAPQVKVQKSNIEN